MMNNGIIDKKNPFVSILLLIPLMVNKYLAILLWIVFSLHRSPLIHKFSIWNVNACYNFIKIHEESMTYYNIDGIHY